METQTLTLAFETRAPQMEQVLESEFWRYFLPEDSPVSS
jgi:hypothetical protein